VRYVGGKSKIARQLAAPINAIRRGRSLWEPFCGGLGMSAAWCAAGPLLLTDACAPLIAMYLAYDAGWRPPTHAVLPAERDAAMTLHDGDPRKAFLRFGCGFGGNWSGGTTRNGLDRATPLALETSNSLARTFAALGQHTFACLDFCAVTPFLVDGVIYCDPPYAGTLGYDGAPAFDRGLFINRVQEWSSLGVDVFVSEYEFPVGTCVLEINRAKHMPGRGMVKERLFKI
jgi:hypothetical protein